ncbi:MAG: 50S ribosomal protein L3 [Patescibacteria group bacterium]|nr:50S ribosomal protein L3 [Patescibacteria group bacterium]
MKFILGKKIGMSRIFNDKGETTPVSLVEAGPCFVAQIKTRDNDKYEAVQIGFLKKIKKIRKTEKGKEYKYLKESKVQSPKLKVGEKIDVSVFAEGDKVRVSGISKGKGFQGAVKKWGFSGRNATHGVKHEHRTVGSVGSTGPARVFPGKKMPGRMGAERTSVKNLEILKIDKENNLIAIKGAIPGPRGALIEIRGKG